jgi:HD-GYP domain-containing protein (c-di-GMP phosphodiesterase class II)
LPRAPAGPSEANLRAKAEREERRSKTNKARERANSADKAYAAAAAKVREAFTQAQSSPRAAVDKMTGIVTEVASAFSSNEDVSILLLSDRLAANNLHTHSINVMLLSLLIAKSQKADEQGLKELGLGALFHDIGMLNVPDSIRMKPEAEWTRADRNYMQKHTEMGAKLVISVPEIGVGARSVIAMHHENFDGSGYPFKLAGEKIPVLARYAAIADRYDELCNPLRAQECIPPSEALARMYKIEGAHFDPNALAGFIKAMGVYPPGSIVELSNGAVGLVTSVNRDNSTRPLVMVWQEGVKPEQAPVIDLSVEPEIAISRTLRPGELTPEVHEFLNPRARTTYFYAKASG